MIASFKVWTLVFVTINGFGESVETHFCQHTTAEVNSSSLTLNDSRILLALIIDTDPPQGVQSLISFGDPVYTEFFQCLTNPNISVCTAHYHNSTVTQIVSSETSFNYSERGQKFRCWVNTTTSLLECCREDNVKSGKNLFMLTKGNKTDDTSITYSPLVALDSLQAIVHILCIEEFDIRCDCFADVIDEFYFTAKPGNHHNDGAKIFATAVWFTFTALFLSLYPL